MATRNALVLGALGAAALLSILIAALVGSVPAGVADLWAALGGETSARASVILELRLPRAAAAFVTGGLLALAGALMQVLLRNPLADPYVLGISGGAAVGALSVMLLGLGGVAVSGGALVGALVSTALVFGLAHGRGGWTPTRLLLTGIVVASGWGAMISFLLAVSPERELRGMLFWLMGDLAHAGWPPWRLGLLVVASGIALVLARPLNLLARGDTQAFTLGVAVAPLRNLLFALSAVLTAAAVTLAGSVGFVGLVVPHLVRLGIGSDHRWLLPASVLLGGTLLTAADVLARTLLAPQQLPVGVFTALLGVPLFLYLLHRTPGGSR